MAMNKGVLDSIISRAVLGGYTAGRLNLSFFFFKFYFYFFLLYSAHVRGKIGGENNTGYRINQHLSGQTPPSHPFWRNYTVLRESFPLEFTQPG